VKKSLRKLAKLAKLPKDYIKNNIKALTISQIFIYGFDRKDDDIPLNYNQIPESLTNIASFSEFMFIRCVIVDHILREERNF